MSERNQLFQVIKAQYTSLGEAGFIEWWDNQDAATARVIQEALADPAFKLLPHQIMPEGDWRIWCLIMGRAAGKTYAASTGANDFANDFYPGGNGILVGATVKDVRDTMIEGDSGIIATARPGNVPRYNKHDNVLEWPNGSRAIVRTADNPEDIRGPTLNWGWADELVKWRDERSWDNLQRCVRNKHERGARLIVTTTPKKAKQWIKDICTSYGAVISTGSTLDNPNLDAAFLEAARRDMNTARGREEVMGLWVEDAGGLWTAENIDKARVRADKMPLSVLAESMKTRFLSVDPSSGKKDSTGIMFGGEARDGKAWIMDDFTIKANIEDWTTHVVKLHDRYMKPGDIVLLETNNNEAARNVLEAKCPKMRVVEVKQWKHKFDRAQEAFTHWHADRVRMFGTHNELELQLREWSEDTKDSPDRGDAMTQLIIHILSRDKAAFRPGFSILGLDL